MRHGLASPPLQTLVVFGASGDLARRKLLPALYDLAYEGLLPERYAIVGSGGSRLEEADFHERARGAVEEYSRRRVDEGRWQAFARGLSYVSAPLDDPAPSARFASASWRSTPSWAPRAAALLLRHASVGLPDDRAPHRRCRPPGKRADRAREADRA